jgi:hypothetical protein
MPFQRIAPFGSLGRLSFGVLALIAALAPHLGGGPVQAGPPAPYPPDVFPPATVFRTLQLTTLACGRENSADRCAEARRQADPLLDHPRLPARCKDVLWSIRNLAVDAPSNSMSRRDPIDQAAGEVTVACRPVLKAKPDAKPQNTGEGGQLKFGGVTGQP